MTEQRKVVYISGPITGVENYWEAFERMDDTLTGMGYTVISPARLPGGMTNAQYMKICLASIDAADVMVLLDGWWASKGAFLERAYCEYIGKPFLEERDLDRLEDAINGRFVDHDRRVRHVAGPDDH